MVSKTAIGNVTQNRTLTEIAMGYSRSRVISAAARLGIADAIGDEEKSVDELAQHCAANKDALYRLLRTLASFGVLAEKKTGHFMLTEFGKPLRKDHPNSEWSSVVFWGDLLADSWSHLTECIRTGENAMQIMQRENIASRWSKDSGAMSIFHAVMGTAPAQDYMPIAKAWDFSKYTTVADLGGGGGGLIAAILEAYPNLKGMLVDRPGAMADAKARFDSNGLGARCQLIVADLCAAVPAGADVYVMKHFLHGFTDEAAVSVLKNCKSVIPAGGRLLNVEFVLPDQIDRPDAELEQRLMSDLNMLAVTGGKERSATQWKELLSSAGFECLKITPVPGDLTSIVESIPKE